MKKLSNISKSCVALTLAMSILSGSGCAKKDKETSVNETGKETEVITEVTERPSSETTKGTDISHATGSETDPSATVDDLNFVEASTETTAPDKNVKLPEEIFTRLTADPITEFVPSSEYGKVYPFLGNTRISGTELRLYGFFDESGRIVCDPIFHLIGCVNGKGYIVSIIDGQSYMQPSKKGYISLDGAFFTGIKYDRIYENDGKLLFVSTSDEKASYASFDPDTNTFGKEKTLKTIKPGEYTEFNRILDDRYLLYTDDLGFASFTVDGTIGELVIYPGNEDLYPQSFEGNLMIKSDDMNSAYAFYSIDGRLLFDAGTYSSYYFDRDYDDCIVLTREDGWDIADLNGNILGSIDNKDHDKRNLYYLGEYFVAVTNEGLLCYDKDFKLVKFTKIDSAKDCQPVPTDYSCQENMLRSFSPLFYNRSGEDITFIDPVAGTTKTVKNSSEYGSPKRLPGRILLTAHYLDTVCWKLLNSSDYCVLAEGVGDSQVNYDVSTDKYYLFSTPLLFQNSEAKIIDMQTGKIFFDAVENPEDKTIQIDGILGYKILYTVTPLSFEDNASKAHPFSVLTDKEGKISFLHFAENGYTN